MAIGDENVTRALLYGTISTLVVSLLSLGGALIIPLVTGKTRHRWVKFFVSMAVATLSSDALLHLIPQILGLHDHGGHGHSHELDGHQHVHEQSGVPHRHEHNHETNDSSHEHHHVESTTFAPVAEQLIDHHHEVTTMWTVTEERLVLLQLSVIMLTIYALYLVEFVVYYRKRQNPCARGAMKSPSEMRIQACEETISNHAWEEPHSCVSKDDLSSGSSASSSRGSGKEEDEKDDTATVVCCGIKSRAMIILLGDAVHNLVDGVAIGASFLVSHKMGWVTTIAVVCHELPHELGDLAVLLESGMSMPKALFLNLMSALTAFIGLYGCVLLGMDGSAERWLLSITAGMFLYVAWIDMLAHLKHDGSHHDHWIVACLIQYAGFLIGFAVIFGLGWFEHQLFAA